MKVFYAFGQINSKSDLIEGKANRKKWDADKKELIFTIKGRDVFLTVEMDLVSVIKQALDDVDAMICQTGYVDSTTWALNVFFPTNELMLYLEDQGILLVLEADASEN